MSEHELWNELGNLYYLSGSFDQAIHAYTRSISLDNHYGRPYGNLALTYAHKGRYADAIHLYLHGIRLLIDDQEKALCWYKLGNVYRHLKEYRQAVEAYQKADELASGYQELDDSGNKADALLNRRPTADDQLPAHDEVFASVPHLESVSIPEELTPWFFEEQAVPDDEPLPEKFEPWFDTITPVPIEQDANMVFIEPLKWDLPVVREMTIVDQPMEHMADMVEPVTAAPKLNGSDASLQLPVSVNQMPVFGAESALQEVTNTQVETMLQEETPIPVTLAVQEMEVIPGEIAFHDQDVTSLDAVQYESPTEVPAAEIPSVQLTSAERSVLDKDIQRFRRGLENNPNNAPGWDTVGGLYKAAGRYNEAIMAFQKAASLDPTNACYFHHLGLVYAAEGRYDDAITAFQRVIEIDPNYSLAHATLGGYYRKKGMEELAQAHIEKAKGLLGANENEYNRACMEAICGNSDRALELLEIALKKKKTYVNWAKRDPDLDFIRSDPRFHALLSEHATRLTQ